MSISGIKQKNLVCTIGNNVQYYLEGTTIYCLSVVYTSGDADRSLFTSMSYIEGYKTIEEIKTFFERLVCCGKRKEIYL